LDLDHFKTINDTLGHLMGDNLLQEVAQRLIDSVREKDTVARLGGDEYIVMLEDLNQDAIEAANQAESIAEKVLMSLCQPYMLGEHEWHNTSSIGITLFNGHKFEINELFQQADIAMYEAKKAGRNKLHFFDPQTQEAINARVALGGELRNALERQQLYLYYQVQVDDLNHPYGVEALIRWIHPERGLIAPNQFIPLSEESELIFSIGQWVMETACAQLESWQKDPLTNKLSIAVNVSAKEFRQTDYVSQVQTILQHHNINPNLLKLELTESILVDDIEKTIETMSELQKIGVRLSLDDFGTGYSSLQYLKRLPINQLKIDQSFVRDITAHENDKAIVTTIIALAHGLNIDVIAEGVETKEQREHLFYAGCKHYQGYYFSKPMPIEQLERQLKQDSKN
ncbi:MAG: EAL domain-containing protein, partial [Gammaproteobacteria bacterium]|nr:EAL domain-containing protein [Gammaproteobacteria bacterium]